MEKDSSSSSMLTSPKAPSDGAQNEGTYGRCKRIRISKKGLSFLNSQNKCDANLILACGFSVEEVYSYGTLPYKLDKSTNN